MPMHLYRHPEIQTGRPYAFDVDAEGWLWEGQGGDALYAHHIHTAEVRRVALPVRRWGISDVKVFGGKLVLAVFASPDYLVYDPRTGTVDCRPAPGTQPIIWFQQKLPDGRLVLFERSERQLLLLEEPAGIPRIVKSPYSGQIGSGQVFSDGLLYLPTTFPSSYLRFDPATNAFVDQIPCPDPDTGLGGAMEHDGTLYISDTARGQLLTLDMATGNWGDSIPIPGHGTVFGFCGACVSFQGRGYYNLSTYRFPSRLDPVTGELLLPEGWNIGVDGYAPRFLDRQLVFDPVACTFDFLTVPPQPDGIPLTCYAWTDGEKLIFSGYVIPFGEPGAPTEHPGDWLIWQNFEATAEPAYGPYDFNFDRKRHIDRYRRSIPVSASLYIPFEPHTPPITNLEGPTVRYSTGQEQTLSRRAAKTDVEAYYRSVLDGIIAPGASDAEKVTAIMRFVNQAHYYNPVRETDAGPNQLVRVMEAHDIRCGDAADLMVALFQRAGVICRLAPLYHHVVAEAEYDGGWHICDALFFKDNQPQRDGRVLSVAELQADPYFADAWSQKLFIPDPECVRSSDGYYILGYNFGEWGWEPYYSYYLGGAYDTPPTLPQVLPPVRLDGRRIRLRWVESVKRGGGHIDYEVSVYADRQHGETLLRATTATTTLVWEVPEEHRMYFIGVRAMDDHRSLNPDTWYPTAVSNFVLVPPETYGWFNVY